MKKSWRWQNKFTGENLLLCQVYSPTNNRTGALRELCTENLPDTMARAGLQSKVESAGLHLQEAKDIPTVTPFHGPVPPHLDIGGWKWAKQLKEDTTMGQSEVQEDIPVLGAGIDWGSIRAPLLNAWAGTSHPPLVPAQSCLTTEQLRLLYERPRFVHRTPWI